MLIVAAELCFKGVSWLSFTLTNTCINQFIKRKGLLWLTVLEVLVLVSCFRCFTPVVRLCVMVGAHGGGSCSSPGGQEVKRIRRTSTSYPFQGYIPIQPEDFQPGPSSFKVPSPSSGATS